MRQTNSWRRLIRCLRWTPLRGGAQDEGRLEKESGGRSLPRAGDEAQLRNENQCTLIVRPDSKNAKVAAIGG